MKDGLYNQPESRSLPPWERIRHYYGDVVRQLFVVAAVVSALSIPFFGDLLPYGLGVQIAAILLLVLLAGLTNPHGKSVMWIDVFVSGFGVLLLESTAIGNYASEAIYLFLAQEAVALLLIVAFYFSVKTLRAMLRHLVGRREPPNEFASGN